MRDAPPSPSVSSPSSSSSLVSSPSSRPRPGRLAALDREIDNARRRLQGMWRMASPADRLFAVDRLLRESLLPVDVQRRLQAVQDVVRDAWVTVRVARAMRDQVPVDVRVAGLQYALVERVRDSFLDDRGIFDALFLVAEGYLRAGPLTGSSFRDLWRQRETLLARLVPILPPLDEPGPSDNEADAA